MYPFWNTIVEPALEAAEATRVVEIGALRGETTVRLLDLLGPESELHVIDPVPIFDPDEHAKRFPGRYIFHRDISHSVLPTLPPADAALIDGDHNWFTVVGELRMLRETARKAGAPLPLLIMHDVGWPYGRRDLYYAPERIPEEHRQPHAKRGIMPGRSELVEGGGINQELENALEEGGQHNGVLTALEDFTSEHDRPLRRVVLPIYYGLALVAEEDLLEVRPRLAEMFDRLESAAGRHGQAELAESIRLQEQVLHHDAHGAVDRRAAQAASLYLGLLKDALLNQHYLENELRIGHLLERMATGEAVSAKKLGDPARYMKDELRHLRETRHAGELPEVEANGRLDAFAYTGIGRVRLDHLERCLDTVRAEAVAGDLVDCGTGRGGSAIFMRGFLEAYAMAGPRLWVADRFASGPPPTDEELRPIFPPDFNSVREGFDRFGLLDGRVNFLQGTPIETLAGAPIEKLALLRIDGQQPTEVEAALEALYDRVALGGFVVVDDYGNPACRDAVDRFRSARGIGEELERIDWSGASWRKTSHAATEAAGRAAPRDGNGAAPLRTPEVPAKVTATKDLAVVVVFHNMRREAERTLHSLSREYQHGVEDLDYEVIVVENGSDPDELLGEELVRSFGPEFRYLDLGDEATPSPAPALNRGIEASGARNFALMIDGAHVLTPGVLRLGMLGIRTYRPAVVATQQWYVGPGQQNEAVGRGYHTDYEDRLFEEIKWPTDGYALFEIGHFIGDRDWFEDQWESNCIFVPRHLIEQMGPPDESFTAPGGGFVNLDFFERMTSSPRVTFVTILGEGSFHQLHGGTTTNVEEHVERSDLIDSYHDEYEELRGRQFRVPAKEMHYVGSLPESARRTKPRRLGAPAYFKLAHVEGPDGRPAHPVPVPEELREEFIDAFWRSGNWQPTTWLGKWTNRPPTDLVAYQELVVRTKPDWIIETRSGGGGRAFFLASICDLVGSGQVLAIDDTPVSKRAEHERITYLQSDPADKATAAEVGEIVGKRARTLVILGADKRRRVLAAFHNLAPFVPRGCYVVIEDTILNGHPVWTGFGPGPQEAAGDIVNKGDSDFSPDPQLERFVLTFNPGGFLKRIR